MLFHHYIIISIIPVVKNFSYPRLAPEHFYLSVYCVYISMTDYPSYIMYEVSTNKKMKNIINDKSMVSSMRVSGWDEFFFRDVWSKAISVLMLDYWNILILHNYIKPNYSKKYYIHLKIYDTENSMRTYSWQLMLIWA